MTRHPTITRLVCRIRGHQWRRFSMPDATGARRGYVCLRCGAEEFGPFVGTPMVPSRRLRRGSSRVDHHTEALVPAGDDVEIFVENDADYGVWLEAHPDGFVANAPAVGDPAPAMLHRARCPRLYPFDPTRPERRRTRRPRACATETESLEIWAATLSQRLLPCPDCQPWGPSGQPPAKQPTPTTGR